MDNENKTSLLGMALLGMSYRKIQEYNAHIDAHTTIEFGNHVYTISHDRIVELYPRLGEFNQSKARTDVDHLDMGNIIPWFLLNYGTPIKPVELITEDLIIVTFKGTKEQELRMAGLRIPVSERRLEIMVEKHKRGEI
jgi:hypothetical protein